MSVINSQPLIGASGQGGAYNLTKSLRFRSSASAYLSRTPSSSGNQQKWTWSGWVKRGSINASFQRLFSAKDPSNDDADCLRFNSGETFTFFFRTTPNLPITGNITTTQVFRDPSAWYHIVAVLDTTDATSSNRMKLYVNGIQVTALSTATYPAQNSSGYINSTNLHTIGNNAASLAQNFDGYMAEVNFIDGQALTPSDFGETDTATGVWIPKKYAGTYGTNGFYLDFEDTSSTTALGYDAAGSNDWTVNNISLTSGSTYDSMKDVPTLTDEDTSNYCVLQLVNTSGSGQTLSNAGLTVQTTVGGSTITYGSIAFPSTGKYYFEVTPIAGYVGVFGLETPYYFGIAANPSSDGYVYYSVDGQKAVDGTASSYGASYTTNDVIGVAVDTTNGTVTFYKNNVSQGNITYSFSGKTIYPAITDGSSTASATYNVNFGQRPFAYTPPTGFKALNTFNLPTPTIGATASTQANKYFDVLTWTGNDSATQTVSGLNFQPDLVWGKNRSAAYYHNIFDAVRGAGSTKQLASNTTGAEGDSGYAGLYGYLSSFNSNGFTATAGTAAGNDKYIWWNDDGASYVAWNWKANGSGSSNTAGSISSTVSANTTAGFSIVTYNSGSSGNKTVGHGLGVAPSMIITKSRTSASFNWSVYHISIATTVNKFLQLNTTNAIQDNGTSIWGASLSDTNSTTFGINSGNGVVASTDCIAYCFAEVAGYSAFGSYTGNGSTDGTFVYTGFRPKLIITKASSTTGNWNIIDTTRNTTNVIGELLYADASDAGATYTLADSLSNGFKLRNSGGNINNSGTTFIYMAFAESPFKYANAR